MKKLQLLLLDLNELIKYRIDFQIFEFLIVRYLALSIFMVFTVHCDDRFYVDRLLPENQLNHTGANH